MADAPISLANAQAQNTKDTIRINWASPVYTGGTGVAITSYKLEMAPAASNMQNAVWTTLVNNLVTSFDVPNLTAGQNLMFRVCAQNTYGMSVASANVNVQALFLPTAVTNFMAKADSITATSLTLTWTQSSSNGGDKITGKVITHTHNGVVVTTNVVPSVTEQFFYGLTPSTTYNFQIASVNSLG
jgi:hypothetical protein